MSLYGAVITYIDGTKNKSVSYVPERVEKAGPKLKEKNHFYFFLPIFPQRLISHKKEGGEKFSMRGGGRRRFLRGEKEGVERGRAIFWFLCVT